MKKHIFSQVIICIAIIFLNHTVAVQAVNEQRSAPSYAKWGQLAMKTAKEKYPNAKIVDYLHMGRETKATTSIEKFKLWAEEEGKEFGLYIHIEFDSKTERVRNIDVNKSSQ